MLRSFAGFESPVLTHSLQLQRAHSRTLRKSSLSHQVIVLELFSSDCQAWAAAGIEVAASHVNNHQPVADQKSVVCSSSCHEQLTLSKLRSEDSVVLTDL